MRSRNRGWTPRRCLRKRFAATLTILSVSLVRRLASSRTEDLGADLEDSPIPREWNAAEVKRIRAARGSREADSSGMAQGGRLERLETQLQMLSQSHQTMQAILSSQSKILDVLAAQTAKPQAPTEFTLHVPKNDDHAMDDDPKKRQMWQRDKFFGKHHVQREEERKKFLAKFSHLNQKEAKLAIFIELYKKCTLKHPSEKTIRQFLQETSYHIGSDREDTLRQALNRRKRNSSVDSEEEELRQFARDEGLDTLKTEMEYLDKFKSIDDVNITIPPRQKKEYDVLNKIAQNGPEAMDEAMRRIHEANAHKFSLFDNRTMEQFMAGVPKPKPSIPKKKRKIRNKSGIIQKPDPNRSIRSQIVNLLHLDRR